MRWWRCPHCRGNRLAHYWPCLKAFETGRRTVTAEDSRRALNRKLNSMRPVLRLTDGHVSAMARSEREVQP